MRRLPPARTTSRRDGDQNQSPLCSVFGKCPQPRQWQPCGGAAVPRGGKGEPSSHRPLNTGSGDAAPARREERCLGGGMRGERSPRDAQSWPHPSYSSGTKNPTPGARTPARPPPAPLTRAGVEGDHEDGHDLVLLRLGRRRPRRFRRPLAVPRSRAPAAAEPPPAAAAAARLGRGRRRRHGGALGPEQQRRLVRALHHSRAGPSGAEPR